MTSARTVDRISRILALIPFVLESGSVDRDEIMSRFGYTEAQLARDINTIFVCGLPGYGPGDLMEAYIDDQDVVIDAADFFARPPRLTAAEGLTLLASGMTALAMGVDSPDLETAVQKLSAHLMPEVDRTVDIEVGPPSPVLPKLEEAARRARVVEIEYWSVGRDEVTTREIEPWSIFTTLGRWYVTGHDRLSSEQRTFRVDRIRAASATGESFEPPAEVPEVAVGYAPRPEDVKCVIDLRPSARWVLEYYPVDVVSESSRKIRVKFHSPDASIAAALLLRLGEEATLVEGPEVAQRRLEMGESIRDLYR